ncbi:MAG: RagB/SusD family nutrient uptake outer membrane protein [Bacteroidales bacterium]
MNHKYIYIGVVLGGMFGWSGCSDFLDKVPDNRAELSTGNQIRDLMKTSYPAGNISMICELSSDNFIDNNSPDAKGSYFHLASYDRVTDEIYAWDDIVSGQQQDSPSNLWEESYHSIAACNHALEAIAKLEPNVEKGSLDPHKGEALVLRAFNHFVLVNVFAQTYRDGTLSQNDPGIPYVTEPERTVSVQYERQSVAEVYQHIEEDLLAGLPLMDDGLYEIPKYHFNKKAAYAFAARFFLFKRDYDQVIKYATLALTENPASQMRDWSQEFATAESFVYGWIKSTNPCNFLLLPTSSRFNRVHNQRYAHNREALSGVLDGSGPTWSGSHPCYKGRLWIRGSQDYGVFFMNAGELFEYTDKVAGIGYPHIVRAEFTAEETLLCRAEAYVFKNQLGNALADLQCWDDSRKNTPTTTIKNFPTLTEALIKSFYTPQKPLFYFQLNNTVISPEFQVSEEQLPYVQCVLHFRRLENIFMGLRWFDLKRYGIEITHKIGKTDVKTLSPLDGRRAIQLPAEVIAAGITPNIRMEKPDNNPPVLAK